jgi:outer membrane protein TolC
MKSGILKVLKRQAATLFLAAGVAALAGCTKPLYMTQETQVLASSVSLPADLATNPNITATPDTTDSKPPPTILDANRDPRPMTLQEAIAIALERGSGNRLGPLGFVEPGQDPGLPSIDDLATSAGRFAGDDSIRAFALDPAIADADVEGALSKFDTRFTGSMSWRKQDQAVANVFNNFNNGDFAALNAGLYKPLPTGGTAAIVFDTNYTKLGAVPSGFAVINPSYTPSVTFSFEQPLLRDAGIDINQLLPQHPGSTQTQFRATGGRSEGILITRIRSNQARLEFERNVSLLVMNVEFVYWKLYSRYYSKYAAEQAVKQAFVVWQQLQQLQVAGLQAKQAVAQALAQLEGARLGYLAALQKLLEAERVFRAILGLPLEDGQRIVPADTPILAPYKPEWNSSLAEALNNRPELLMVRQDLKVQQLKVMLQENQVRPDLRFFANYNINAIGNQLDGTGPESFIDGNNQIVNKPGNALGGLFDNKFNNFAVGLRFDYPLGYRDAYASLKVEQLNLARSHVVLKNQERKLQSSLGGFYQQLAAYPQQISLQQSRRIALGNQLQGQFERVKIGKDPLIQLFDAQTSFTVSIQGEADAICNYNIAIAAFQYTKGTLLKYNNVTIGDGPLPAAVAERAADHFGARSAALKLRERPANPSLPNQEGVPVSVHGLADGPPPPEVTGSLKPESDAPPPMTLPGVPIVIPPTAPPAPKDVPPAPPKTASPIFAPAPLPGLSFQDTPPIGPAMPAAGSDSSAMPATPVSQYRLK